MAPCLHNGRTAGFCYGGILVCTAGFALQFGGSAVQRVLLVDGLMRSKHVPSFGHTIAIPVTLIYELSAKNKNKKLNNCHTKILVYWRICYYCVNMTNRVYLSPSVCATGVQLDMPSSKTTSVRFTLFLRE